MTSDTYHVIMAGGSGTRFWPVSRPGRPKQFLVLAGDKPLLRQACDRATRMSATERVYIVAGPGHRETALSLLPGFDPSHYIEEPCARNTAPCIGLAALRLRRVNPDGIMVVTPADHVYTRPGELERAVATAVESARDSASLVTLGIRPTRPETGYGYIEATGEVPPSDGQAMRVSRFVEKPDTATAKQYVDSGRFFWNSGIFIWRISAILSAIEECAPDLADGLARIDSLGDESSRQDEASAIFASLKSISIDYAVLEKAENVLVVAADPGWSDVGSWDSAAELAAPGGADQESNTAMGGGPEPVLVRSRDCFVYSGSSEKRHVALVGVEGLIVVETEDAILICRKGESQAVREVVAELDARGGDGKS